jgi:photosystem II stability/assembly factor-like uncharacterized protein
MRVLQFHASSRPVRRHFSTVGRSLVVAVVAVTAFTAPAMADDDDLEWSVQAPLASRSLLLDVAAADGRLVAVGERGHILISDDVGTTWRQVEVPTRSNLTGVFFLDGEHGWAVGHDAVILRTADGGATWERVHWAPEEESPLFDVWFADTEQGYAVGAYGSVYVTADGGETWDFVPISEDDFHLHRLVHVADGTLFLAAEAGIVYRSDDDGATWEELPSPYDGSFFGVVPLGEGVILAYGLRGHLFRSEDDGDSWTEIDTGTTAMLTDGVVLSDGTVLIVGLAGTMLTSHDGGRTFDGREPADRRGIAAVTEGAGGAVVMVGEFGVRTVAAAELAASAGAAEGGAGR